MIEISLTTVEDALNGKREAIDLIIRTLESPIFTLAYRMLLNQDDAKDATQEALIRIITRMSTYDGKAKFTTWAWRVAFNRIIDYKSTQYSQSRFETEQFIEDIHRGLNCDDTENPEDALMLTQLKIGCATAMLHTLDGIHRAAYILVEIMEFSTKESAQILDVNEVNLRQQVSRARLKLRDILDHCGIVNPSASCRCCRRLDIAKERGRIPKLKFKEPINLEEMSKVVSKIDGFAQMSAFYRAEPALYSELKTELLSLSI
jgi:RNA polymerase sigma factor (sigma-70 family)